MPDVSRPVFLVSEVMLMTFENELIVGGFSGRMSIEGGDLHGTSCVSP